VFTSGTSWVCVTVSPALRHFRLDSHTLIRLARRITRLQLRRFPRANNLFPSIMNFSIRVRRRRLITNNDNDKRCRRRLIGRSVVYTIDITHHFILNWLARHDRHRRASRAAMRLNYVLNLLQLVKVSSNSIFVAWQVVWTYQVHDCVMSN